MYLRDFFALKPFRDYSNMLSLHFTLVCVLLLVCSLHFTLSLHFTPGPQSAVCSPQSAFYTDRFSRHVTRDMLFTWYMVQQPNVWGGAEIFLPASLPRNH